MKKSISIVLSGALSLSSFSALASDKSCENELKMISSLSAQIESAKSEINLLRVNQGAVSGNALAAVILIGGSLYLNATEGGSGKIIPAALLAAAVSGGVYSFKLGSDQIEAYQALISDTERVLDKEKYAVAANKCADNLQSKTLSPHEVLRQVLIAQSALLKASANLTMNLGNIGTKATTGIAITTDIVLIATFLKAMKGGQGEGRGWESLIYLTGGAVVGATNLLANTVSLTISKNEAREMLKAFSVAVSELRKQQDVLEQTIAAERVIQ